MRTISRLAGVAQLVEQLIRNQQVAGSSPIAGSIVPPNEFSVFRDFLSAIVMIAILVSM
jgi:hypothetical protein